MAKISELERGDLEQMAEELLRDYATSEAENKRLREAVKEKQEVLDSAAGCLVSQPRDFSVDHRDAWLYWLLFGWGDAEDEILSKHKWSNDEVRRLKRLRKQALKPEQEGTEPCQ